MVFRDRIAALVLIPVFVCSNLCSAGSSDQLETLIDQQKKEQSSWTREEGDLPPLELSGDQKGILIYQAGLDRSGQAMLCSDIEFDELLETAELPDPNQALKVNTTRSRIRESIEEHCMIRPGDPVLAVGPGWQELVTVNGFEIRPDKSGCPDDPVYTLWATYDGALPETPYFFSTNLDLPTGPNKLSSVDGWKAEPLTPLLKARLAADVSFLDEYDGKAYSLGLPGCDHLIHLFKRKISNDDNELPNEILACEKDGAIQLVLIERIDLQRGSGHIRPLGLFDLDRDANLELVLEGDHQGCVYQAVFKGLDFGFERLSVPFLPCQCS